MEKEGIGRWRWGGEGEMEKEGIGRWRWRRRG